MRRRNGGAVTTVKLPKTFIARVKVVTGERTANRAVRLACVEGMRVAKRRRLQALAGTFRLPYLQEGREADIARERRLQPDSTA